LNFFEYLIPAGKTKSIMLNKLIVLVVFLLITKVKAQENNELLFTIDEEKVYTSEFIRVYQKNKDIIVESDEKDFDSYFDRFVNFKLKLKQARDLKFDTLSSYKNELSKYKEQLMGPYLQDPEATEALIVEAYERTVNEVNVSHILVRINQDVKPSDTLVYFNKISEARNKIVSGTPFQEVAIQYSEDPSVKTNNGDLGYFSAFSMVYEFENAAYNTEIGNVSKPFRTQFGYHVVKVNDKRKSIGEVEIAHIMVKNKISDSTYSKNKIFDIYKKLQQGGDFAIIAQEHSDDSSSSKKGGKLPKFGSGMMIKSFEIVAFNLKNENDFSAPFETNYGWHILKLIKRYPIKSIEELHDHLESKIKNGTRSKYVEKAFANELAKGYRITQNKEVLSSFYSLDILTMKSDKPILEIENKIFTANDFYIFITRSKNQNIEELYDQYKSINIINYYKAHLEETNKEFAITFQEYKDGLLLFEMLQKKIWDKSEKDTVGLNEYFQNNTDKYTWKRRGDLTIASCTVKEKAFLVKNLLEEGKSPEEIKKIINEGATIHVLFSRGTLEEGSGKLPEGYVFGHGVSPIYSEKDKQFTIIRVNSIIQPRNKKLDETRGQVINDYQNYLEEQWIKSLRKKYKLKINSKALKDLKNQIKNN
jgi:peptidyl-prolyl cis-trans isomerase SurA